jgi:AcrR family transcriptional regulator
MASRSRWNRGQVLDAALAVIDREGLHGFTIRALAAALGASPMSLYSHFESKNELLDLAFERLLERLVPAPRRDGWRAEVEALCRHMRATLLEHPHWIALLARVAVPPSALAVYDRLLGLMTAEGFDPEAAMFAFSSAVSLVLGYVLTERMMGGARPVPSQRLELVRGKLAQGQAYRYPHAAQASAHFDRWSFDEVFEVELQALLAGLEELSRAHGSIGGRSA